ncbi:hypothetical protein N801_03905 [Knoellia aerolata DSM 18566]|uniref:Uncharacterized protein n=1 Tax=Knoellia aerolata DSM 18566 TaxID=1385519 RepID=A0A0A0JXB6_9MICO|nr:hypothetical protein N801_03905 [Knoellia aerolata DSM 18566]
MVEVQELGFERVRFTCGLGWAPQVAFCGLFEHLWRREYMSDVLQDGSVDNVDGDVEAGSVPVGISGREVVVPA